MILSLFENLKKVLKSKKAADQPQKSESKQISSKNSESTSENSNASSSNTKAKESEEATEAKQAKINEHIKKLETRLRRINRKIKELEEDSDWSDGNDENSPYILEDKYKKKAVQIHKKIQEYRQEQLLLGRAQERQIKLDEDESFPGLARKIQKYVNRNTDLPDIQDYKDLIQKWDTEKKLKPKQIEALSRK